ncbi:hypothetical protein Tco_1117231 [Tanacetum coccineum]
MYHSFPRRYFKHDLVSYLKLEGFLSYVSIALLTITSDLDVVLDLDDSLSCLVDDLWASELTISNFSPADRRSTLMSIQCLEWSSLNAGVVTVVVRKFYQCQFAGDKLYTYLIEYLELYGETTKNVK